VSGCERESYWSFIADVCYYLQVYNEEAGPVERVFEDHGLLLNFEITGGIPETLPKLREVVQPFLYHLEEKRAA
jgi:hypothetical protein